jgi:hypothetical protein
MPTGNTCKDATERTSALVVSLAEKEGPADGSADWPYMLVQINSMKMIRQAKAFIVENGLVFRHLITKRMPI